MQVFKSLIKYWMVFGKVALAGASILAIGFALVVFSSPTGDVAEAEADIWDLFRGPTSKHQNFVQALREEGMSAPRSYDWNGNKVFFSYSTTNETPTEVMGRMQDALARNGVNKRAHFSAREPVPMEEEPDEETFLQAVVGANDFFTGGMIPITTTRNHMAMVGMETKGKAKDLDEFLKEWDGANRDVDSLVGAIRYLDAEREEGSLLTTITATWSDEDFDLTKFQPHAQGTAHLIDFEIPMCVGCTRVSRISGERHESDYHSLLYQSPTSVAQTAGFYDSAMLSRGWQLDPALRAVLNMQEKDMVYYEGGRMRSYVRDGQKLTLLVYADSHDGSTYVKAQVTN
ncbi:MAG: hypothetical protein ACNA8W_07395 [Bradymonadaceae bacterium]